jgi:ABC-type enterochelin transport system permease subunit
VLAGVLLVAFAIAQFIEPAEASNTNRSLVARLAVSMFGPKGPAITSVLVALVFLYMARFIWRRTGKKPHDRLWR